MFRTSIAIFALFLVQFGWTQSNDPPVFSTAERVVDRVLYNGTIELGDFDGDGDLDVFTAGNGNNTLAWFAQEAPGVFGWAQLFPEETMADDWHDFTLVDWNGDGLLDILACEEGGLVFLAQQEEGTLAPAATLHASPNPFRLSVADVNGDGVPDVTCADDDVDEVVVLIGDGAGGAALVLEEAFSGAALTLFADWNGDGIQDWLYGSYTWGELYVRQGFGNGGFAPAEMLANFGKLSAIAVLPGATPGSTADLILGVEDTYVLHWHGDGTPADTLGLFGRAQAFAFGDATGDGVLDIAVAAQTTNECGLIVGNPSGGFLPEPTEFSMPQAIDVEMADLDGDGVSEMLTASRTRGQVGYRDFDASGAELSYAPLIEGLQYVRNAATGDLNGDGRQDLAVMVQGTNLYAGGPEYLNVAMAQADGGFEVSYVPTGTYFGYDVVFADYDHDGDLDAAVSDYNGDRVVGLRNDGLGQLVLADTLIADINGCDDLVFEDLDGDGDLDLVAAAWLGSSVVWALNNGGGAFGEPEALSDTGSRCEAVVAGDFNADGWMDLAACFENSGDVRVWLHNGQPDGVAFAFAQELALTSAQDLAMADADADGDLDLFGIGYNETGVIQFTNDGVGGFSSGLSVGFTDANGALGLTAGDPDGDGRADLIISEYGAARTRLYHAASGAVVELATGSGPQSAHFVDLDGDDDQDVLMTFYGAAEIKWAALQSGMQPPPCLADLTGDGWVTTADLTSFLASYGCGAEEESESEDACGLADFEGDGKVGVHDLLILLGRLGEGCL